MDDDGTQPFGDHTATIGEFHEIVLDAFRRADWDTPEWREEMAEKYPCPAT
jgi:hypothetical protein